MFGYFEQKIPWDPNLEDLGSEDQISIIQAIQRYSRRVQQQIQANETIDRPSP